MEEKKKVYLYTDGAAKGNPGRGGFGVVLIYKDKTGKEFRKEISKGYKNTTNNRMELLSAIVGLESLKAPCNVELCSDSKYLIDAFEKKWIESWQKNNWKTSSKSPVKNVDLWQRLLKVMSQHEIKFIWVKGHAGHEFNERCDELATTAANDTENLLDDDF